MTFLQRHHRVTFGPASAQDRLEYLRSQIEAERISYGEIAELQDLAEHIDPDDVQLLEWAGVPEDLEERAAFFAERGTVRHG